MFIATYVHKHPLYTRQVMSEYYVTAGRLRISRQQSWWRHHMETFSALLPICAGNSPVNGEFPAQRPVTRSFDVFFDPAPD